MSEGFDPNAPPSLVVEGDGKEKFEKDCDEIIVGLDEHESSPSRNRLAAVFDSDGRGTNEKGQR